jgi:hypothetical protein
MTLKTLNLPSGTVLQYGGYSIELAQDAVFIVHADPPAQPVSEKPTTNQPAKA